MQPKVSDQLSNDRGSGEHTPTDLPGQCEQVGRSLAHDDDLRTWLRDEEAAGSNPATPTRSDVVRLSPGP